MKVLSDEERARLRAEVERRDADYLAACEALSAAWTANAIERQRRRVLASIEKETPDAERADGEAADRA